MQPTAEFLAKLYQRNDDISLVVSKEGSSKTDLLKSLIRLFEQDKSFSNISIVTEGKHPILRIKFANYRLEFHVNRFDLEEEAIEVAKNMKAWPEAYYLTYFMQLFLRQRDLSNTAQGGMSLFLLHCLTVAFVKHYKKRIASRGQKDLENALLSEYCLKFLEFYGLQFDTSKTKIILGNGDSEKENGFVEKTPSSKDSGLSVFYPRLSNLDYGQSTFKAKEVFNCLKNRYFFLTNYNFVAGESVLKYLVNPSKANFMSYLN